MTGRAPTLALSQRDKGPFLQYTKFAFLTSLLITHSFNATATTMAKHRYSIEPIQIEAKAIFTHVKMPNFVAREGGQLEVCGHEIFFLRVFILEKLTC
jgi:hypothetical protein